jgi:hypothetical protein
MPLNARPDRRTSPSSSPAAGTSSSPAAHEEHPRFALSAELARERACAEVLSALFPRNPPPRALRALERVTALEQQLSATRGPDFDRRVDRR